MPKVTSDGYYTPQDSDPASVFYTPFDPMRITYHQKCGLVVFDKAAHEAWHKRVQDAMLFAITGDEEAFNAAREEW